MTDVLRSTLGDERRLAEICRANGWDEGTTLIAKRDGGGYDLFCILFIGQNVVIGTLNGGPQHRIILSKRPWFKLGASTSAAHTADPKAADAPSPKPRTTLGDRRHTADVCREWGWAAGTVLEAPSYDVPGTTTLITITAVGLRRILATDSSGHEGTWYLSERNWTEVRPVAPPNPDQPLPAASPSPQGTAAQYEYGPGKSWVKLINPLGLANPPIAPGALNFIGPNEYSTWGWAVISTGADGKDGQLHGWFAYLTDAHAHMWVLKHYQDDPRRRLRAARARVVYPVEAHHVG